MMMMTSTTTIIITTGKNVQWHLATYLASIWLPRQPNKQHEPEVDKDADPDTSEQKTTKVKVDLNKRMVIEIEGTNIRDTITIQTVSMADEDILKTPHPGQSALHSLVWFCTETCCWLFVSHVVKAINGGSRIPKKRGPTPKVGRQPIFVANFLPKLHENDKRFGPRGGGGGARPLHPTPLDPPMVILRSPF